MGWIRWGIYAARRASRRSRRSRYLYENPGFQIMADYLIRLGQKKQVAPGTQPQAT